MLIDSTYFVNEIYLSTNEFQTLTSSIERYEKDYLQKVLGYSLAKDVAAYSETSTDAVKALVEGAEYESNGYTLKWNGLKNTDKISAIAFYVYCRYLEDRATIDTPIGSIDPNHENSNKADESHKYIKAWANCVELTGHSYQSWDEPSMFKFILSNQEDYPTCIFKPLEHKNILGI
jgi:hypothetical protein